MQKTKTQYRFLISFLSLFISGFLFSDTVFAACSIRGTAYNDFECTGDSSKPSCSSSEIEGTPAFIDCNSGSSAGMGATCCVSRSLVRCEDGGMMCESGTCEDGQCVDDGGGSTQFVTCDSSQGYVCMSNCPNENTGSFPCNIGDGSDGFCCKNTVPGGGTPPPGGGTPPPGGGGTPPPSGGSRGWNPGELHATFPGLSVQPIEAIIENLVQWFLYIIGFLAIIAFIISAIQYFLAGADEEMSKKAKNSMVLAIIGVVVALSGLVIIYAIDAILNAGGSI